MLEDMNSSSHLYQLSPASKTSSYHNYPIELKQPRKTESSYAKYSRSDSEAPKKLFEVCTM